MLDRKHRLAKQSEVKLTFAKGRSFFSPYFLVKYLKKPENSSARFTVVASTKVSKKAVVRNRLKRIVREALRKNLDRFQPGDYIVSIKPSLLKLPSQNIRQALDEFLLKSRIIR